VLAILARIAIGILGSDHQPGLSDREIAALFRAGALSTGPQKRLTG
jgi:hypothetical protein